MDRYDVIVIGGDLAALTAGLFAARHGHETLVLSPGIPGDHLANLESIEDFPGFPESVPGYELCPAVQEQAANAGAQFAMEQVSVVQAVDAGWQIETDGGQYQARAIIVASGTHPAPIGVPGEERWYGKGISHCASCDGPLFRNKPVAVIGGGDLALQEALTVAKHAEQVFLIDRESAFSGQDTYQQRVLQTPSISILRNTVVEEVLGDSTLDGIRVRNQESGEVTDVDVVGVFAYAGELPNTAFLKDLLPLSSTGHVPTDAQMHTTLPGVFAAGDIRQDAVGLAVVAAGDGAAAAIAAHRYLAARS